MNAGENRFPVIRLIMVPAVISLVVTLIRLAGELNQGSSLLFNAEAGGPLGVVGIVWLVPIFGMYFAVKLTKQGYAPRSLKSLVGRTFLSLAVTRSVEAEAPAAEATPPWS